MNKITKIFLLIIILLDFMGMASSIVIFPHIFLDKVQGIIIGNTPREAKLLLLGICLSLYPIGQFCGSTFFGKLSDKFGRKKILIITLLGTTFGFLLSGLSIHIFSLYLLLFSRLLTGFCAGNVSIAQASLIDISFDDKSKTKNITESQIAMGTAYIIGPIFGSLLADSSINRFFNFATPFFIFSIFLVLITMVGIFLYNETIKKKNLSLKINIFDSFLGLKNILSTRGNLKNAILVWLIFCCGWWLFEAYLPTFLFEQFKLRTIGIGHIIAFNGTVFTIMQYTLAKKLMHKYQPKQIFVLGALGTGFGILLSGIIHNTILLYLSMAIFASFIAFAIPAIITYISSFTDSHNHGTIMGLVNSTQAMSTVSVMLIGGVLNGLNDHAPIIIGGATVLCSVMVFLFLKE